MKQRTLNEQMLAGCGLGLLVVAVSLIGILAVCKWAFNLFTGE